MQVAGLQPAFYPPLQNELRARQSRSSDCPAPCPIGGQAHRKRLSTALEASVDVSLQIGELSVDVGFQIAELSVDGRSSCRLWRVSRESIRLSVESMRLSIESIRWERRP